MSIILHESDFLAVNLKSVIGAQKVKGTQINNPNRENPNAEIDSTSDKKQTAKNIYDWGSELKKRLSANKGLSSEARESDYAIENKFFKEYFSANWDAACAKQLMLMGEPLKKALKVLGFDKQVNPILAFLMDDFVKENLIKTKLLNINTFKAIYNAVAKKHIIDSQFFKANDYNIIYCPDLYKKPVSEIAEYITEQKQVLTKITKEAIVQNKKVFLALPEVSAKTANERIKQIQKADVTRVSVQKFTLNNIKLVKEIKNNLVTTNKTPVKHLDTAQQAQLVQKLDTPAKMLAAIQFLSVNTKNSKAIAALTNKKFNGVSRENLLKATLEIADFMPKDPLAKKDVASIVTALLGKL